MRGTKRFTSPVAGAKQTRRNGIADYNNLLPEVKASLFERSYGMAWKIHQFMDTSFNLYSERCSYYAEWVTPPLIASSHATYPYRKHGAFRACMRPPTKFQCQPEIASRRYVAVASSFHSP